MEQCVLDLHDSFDDLHVLLWGDLNARTASQNYTGISEDFEELMVQTDSLFPRKSQDDTINTFGQQLLEFCNMYDCIILNGLWVGEHEGEHEGVHQLLAHLQEDNLCIPFQFAYRTGHSIETVLLRVVNDLLTAMDEDKISVLLLQDI